LVASAAGKAQDQDGKEAGEKLHDGVSGESDQRETQRYQGAIGRTP